MTDRAQRYRGDGPGFWDDDWREHTTPTLPPVRGGLPPPPGGPPPQLPGRPPFPTAQPPRHSRPVGSTAAGGTVAGSTVAGSTVAGSTVAGSTVAGEGFWDQPVQTAEQYSPRPAAVRRPDAVAAVFALLAGAATAMSLLLYWLKDSSATGWSLVTDGVHAARDGADRVFALGYWQPLAVVLCGGLLFLLGLLMVVPMRTHRLPGVLALLASTGAGAGVLVPLAQDGWHTARYDDGMWFACAAGALGLVAALKAMLTGPRLTGPRPGSAPCPG